MFELKMSGVQRIELARARISRHRTNDCLVNIVKAHRRLHLDRRVVLSAPVKVSEMHVTLP